MRSVDAHEPCAYLHSMKHDPIASGKRKAVNVSIDPGIVAAARVAGVNMSRVSEDALRVAIKAAQEARWREDNAHAIEGWNRWYEKNGHPLEKYRAW